MNHLTSRFYAEYRQALDTVWLDCKSCNYMETMLVDGSIRCVGCGYEWNPKQ